jgi:hypothetical protein
MQFLLQMVSYQRSALGFGNGLARKEFTQLGGALVGLTSRTVLSSSIFV